MARKPHTPGYCRHKSRNLGYALFNGRKGRPTYFPGRYGSEESQAAYRAALAEWLAVGRVGATRAGPVEVWQLILDFHHHIQAQGLYEKNGRPTSEQDCLRAAFRSLRELYPDRSTADIGLAELDALRQHMAGKGWSEKTVRTHLSRVRSLLRWGEGRGLVPAGLTAKLDAAERGLGTGKRKKAGRPTAKKRPADLAAVGPVALVAGPPVCSMIWLQLLNGIRPGGVCALRPCDLDRTDALWRYDEPVTYAAKTGRETHWLGPRAQAILTPYLERTPPGAFLFQPSRRPGAAKGRMTVNHYRRTVTRLCDELGLMHWHPNQLRHNHGTEVRRLYGLDAARARLGHTRASMTETYAHRDDVLARRVAAEIG